MVVRRELEAADLASEYLPNKFSLDGRMGPGRDRGLRGKEPDKEED